MASYITLANIEKKFGQSNVQKWANVDNDDNLDKIAAKQRVAMDDAEGYINSRLRGKGYVIPFAAPYPSEIVRITALRAAVELYMSRGVVDADPGENAMQSTINEIERTLGQIISGRIKLDVVRDEYVPRVEEFEDDKTAAQKGAYVE